MSCVSLNPTEKHCDGLLDLGFIIDSSGSIGRSSWREVKRFLLSLAKRLTVSPGRTHIGALTFDTGARMEFCFNDGDKINAVEDKFEAMTAPSGYTYTDEALKLANEQLFSSSCGMRENAAKVCTFSYNAVFAIPTPLKTCLLTEGVCFLKRFIFQNFPSASLCVMLHPAVLRNFRSARVAK